MDTPRNPQLTGLLLVLTAAALWGTLGTFYKLGTDTFGLTPLTVVFWRAALAGIVLAVVLGIIFPLLGKGWSALRVRRADLPVFITFGLLGVTAFYLLYIYAVVLVGVAVAVVLLYTAPAFVVLMSWRFLGEDFGPRKLAALLLTLLGCALVVRVYDPSLLQANLVGILCGIGSAFTYALYSILGKVSLRRGYPIATMSFYVYTIGALGLLLVAFLPNFLTSAPSEGPGQLFAMGADPAAWSILFLLATAQTIGALYAYTAGLRHLEAGTASIVATFEPLVAALLAYFVLHETLQWPQLLGGSFILLAILLLQARKSGRNKIALAAEP
jgi:DME family drug/metabolite transporter